MSRIISLYLAVVAFSCSAVNAQIIADYSAVARFDSIPEQAVLNAAGLRLMFQHASIGFTITNALDCIQGTRASPAQCTTYTDYYYDRRSWVFQARGNSGWYQKLDDFSDSVEFYLNSFDVFTFKYCYLDGLDGLAVPCGSPFSNTQTLRAWDSLRVTLERLELAHPSKTFIWFTIPLTQQVGQLCTDTLNSLIRSYARTHNKVLFDIADIENHDSLGNPIVGTSGYSVAYRPNCGEQQPDAQSCHPNWNGSIIIAKALWWLMARIAGWSGVTSIVNENGVINVAPIAMQISASPNPFRSSIMLRCPGNAAAKILIENMNGRLVKDLTKSMKQGAVTWNATGRSAGVYVVKIISPGRIAQKKIVFAK